MGQRTSTPRQVLSATPAAARSRTRRGPIPEPRCHFQLHFGTKCLKYSAKVRFQASIFRCLCRQAIGYSSSGAYALWTVQCASREAEEKKAVTEAGTGTHREACGAPATHYSSQVVVRIRIDILYSTLFTIECIFNSRGRSAVYRHIGSIIYKVK